MNRIQAMIERQQEHINERLAASTTSSGEPITADTLEQQSRNLDMDMEEFIHFQNLKSAYMNVLLTESEAQTIYNYLGTLPSTFNKQPLAVKIVLTKVFSELLSKRVKGR